MAPISKTRAEISFLRLLSRCEELAKTPTSDYWKLENYIAALEEKLSNLKKIDIVDQPTTDVLLEYSKKVEFLRNFTDSQRSSKPAEKKVNVELIAPSAIKSIPTDIEYPAGEQIQAHASSRANISMRDDLMLTSKERATGLRNRGGHSPNQGITDAGEVLKHHQKMHEQIAGEMLDLTRSLKHNITASRKVIQDDLETLDKSNKQTDSNLGTLKTASSRLEGHLQKGANWWLWICLALVCAVFLFMIFFIRFFPKR